VSAFILALTLGASGQAPGLKIVVLEGEGAVNIIQQKTAVAPIVEVRDRNDLPVSGAAVTFTIGGNNATFTGGLRTLTVTTNAAGRAAVTGLNPVASGGSQISVQATFQGQTATTTIAQSNVPTASQSGSGANEGSGGGLSGGAIAGIAGSAAGAAVAGIVLRKEKEAAAAPAVPQVSRYDGNWTGGGAATSSLATPARANFTFTVSNGVVTQLDFSFTINTIAGTVQAPDCGGSGSIEGLPIDDESFSRTGEDETYAFNVRGAFTSNRTVTGVAVLTRQPDAPPWCGSATIPWSGTKQ
jgi:hypothetical protein